MIAICALLWSSLGWGMPVVFVPLDSLRPPPPKPAGPPRGWLLDRMEVELSPGTESALSFTWTLHPLEPGWVDIPLIDDPLTVSSATMDGRPVPLVHGIDGMLHLTLMLDRPHRIEVEGTVSSPESWLRLVCAPAARRVVRIRGPWEVQMKGAVVGRGRLDGGDPSELTLNWKPAGPRPPRPTLLRAESASALRLDAGGVEADAVLRYHVFHGSVEQVSFHLPSGVESLEVQGDGVLSSEQVGDEVQVHLARPVSDSLALRVSYRASSPGEGGATLPVPWPDSAETAGWTTLIRADEAVVVPEVGAGADPVTLKDLPDWAQGLAEGTPFAAYHLSGQSPALGARLVRWDPIEGPPTVVDEARYEVATADQGRMILRVRYQVRNDRRQFLRLVVPDELDLISVTVAGRAAQASRDDEGHLLIPLEKSVETLSGLVTFPVDIAFLGSDEAWAKRGVHGLQTPSVDAPIAYARWELVLPPGYEAEDVVGNAHLVPDWSNRAQGLSYGHAYGSTLEDDGGEDQPASEELVVEDRRRLIKTLQTRNLGRGYMPAPEPEESGRADTGAASGPSPVTAPAAPSIADNEDISQNLWNQAYDAYKDNRFEESAELLDQSLAYNPDNQAAKALQGNVSVLLDTSGGEVDKNDEESAARRVRDMARAKTQTAEIQQEALERKAEEAERAGDYEEAEKTLSELAKVSGVLAGVEQSEQVDKKAAYREVQSRLSSVREKLATGESGPEPEPKPPPPASATGLGSLIGSNSSGLGGLGSRGSGVGGGGSSSGTFGKKAPHGRAAGGDDLSSDMPAVETPAEPDVDYDGIPDEVDAWSDDDLPTRDGYATIVISSPDDWQLTDGLVVDPDIDDMLTGNDLVWNGDEDLRTEVVYNGMSAYGSGLGGGGSGYGSGGLGTRGRGAVTAVPGTLYIPHAGQVLRLEARLIPEGQPLTASITYHPSRGSRAR